MQPSAVHIKPYPTQRWRKLRGHQLSRQQQLLTRLPLSYVGEAPAELMRLLGAAVSVRTTDVQLVDAAVLGAELSAAAVAVRWQSMAQVGAGAAVLLLDQRLALCVVDRLLGGEAGESLAAVPPSITRVESGILAYGLARLASQMSSAPWQIAEVSSASPQLGEWIGESEVAVWSLDVAIGVDRGWARIVIGAATLQALPPTLPLPQALRSLGGVELVATVDIGRTFASLAELASLKAGDVLLVDEAWALESPPAAPLQAALKAAALLGARLKVGVLGASRTVWWCRNETDGLRLLAVDATVPSSFKPQSRAKEKSAMHTENLSPVDWRQAVDQLGDAPLEVAIEVARLALPLEELAALRPGQVLRLGRGVDSQVTLRVGQRTVASGELVDVDGEIGVRLQRIGA